MSQTRLPNAPLPSASCLTGFARPPGSDLKLQKSGGQLKMPTVKDAEVVGSLSNAAQRHLSSMARSPGTPYQRPMTPKEKEQVKAQVQKMAEAMKANTESSTKVEGGGDKGTEAGDRPSTSSGANSAHLGMPSRLAGGNRQSCPATPLSVQTFNMARPVTPLAASKAAGSQTSLAAPAGPRLSKLPPPAGKMAQVSASWSGPISELKAIDAKERGPGAASGAPRPSTPSAALRHPLRSGDTLPLLSSEEAQRPGTATSVGGRSTHGPTSAHPTPSRGMVFSVFRELDPHLIGKITYSKFEQAAVECGLKEDQCRKLFDTIDVERKGFISLTDWRAAGKSGQHVSNFTRMYLANTKSQYILEMHTKQVPSLYMAMQMAMTKMQVRKGGKAIPYTRLLDAFNFMDADGSGALDLEEVKDAFHGMGINITQDVAEEIMHTFDKNGDGRISYQEFGRSLFPVNAGFC